MAIRIFSGAAIPLGGGNTPFAAVARNMYETRDRGTVEAG